jgi:nuclear pore complex protein Nup133
MDSTLQKIRSSSYRPSRSVSKSHAGSVASSRMGSVGPASISESLVNSGMPEHAEPLKEGIVELTKNTKYAVLQLPAVPSVLRTPEEQVYEGAADQNTGHALVITPNTTYVWNYTSPEHVPSAIPFVYPESPKGTQSLLVSPSSGSKEPGLVTVVSDSGLCTYWEAVGRAVADGLLHRRKSIEHTISLYSGEVIENFEAIEPAGIIATTSSGRFIFVTLRDQFGKPHVSSTTMTGRTQGFLSSIKGAISLAPYRRGIVSIKPGPFKGRTDRQALIISGNGDLSVWECLRTGQTKLLFDNSLKEVLVNYISGVYPHSAESFAVHDVEVFEEQQSIFILSSFVHSLDQIFYVLYTVSLGDGNEVKIASAHRLQTYTSDSTQQPRIILPKASQTLFVVFSNAVVLLDTLPKKSEHGISTRWEDVVSFYTNIEIIGSAAEDPLVVNRKVIRQSGIVLIATTAGVIRIERYSDEQETESGNVVLAEQQLEPQLARSTIEQAIFYGSKSDAHYLDFNVRKEIEFDSTVLEKAFLSISSEILNTTSRYMPPVLPSMKDHLDLRVSYLAGLAEYLHHNFNGAISVDARFALLADLEKANAARALWQHVDGKLQHSITEDSVVSIVIGSLQSGDALRDWFLHNVSGNCSSESILLY